MRDQFLRSLARLVLTSPRGTVAVVLLLLAAGGAVVPGLRVQAGHSALVAEDDVHQQRFDRFLRTFGSPNMLMAVVEGGDEALRRGAVDYLTKHLPGKQAGSAKRGGGCAAVGKNATGCVRDVMGGVDLDRVKSHALLYAPVKTLEIAVKMLTEEAFGLKTLLKIDSLESMLSTLAGEIERRAGTAPLPKGDQRKQAEAAMGMLGTLFDEITRRVKDPDRAAVGLEEALVKQPAQAGVDARGYFSSADGKIKVAMVRPVNDSDEPTVVVPFVGYVRRHAEAAVKALGGRCAKAPCADGPLRITLTGLPAIIADETVLVNRDVLVTTLVAICGILALFIFGFRSVRQSVLGLAPLLVGLVLTLAFVRLAFGTLNLVTAAFIATLLGLGIDFAVHLLSRFNEGRREGLPVSGAVEAAIMGAGPGILTGALTTAGAFVALSVNDFLAFSQLGMITGVGLLFVLGVTMTLMPAMLALPSLARLQGKPRKPSGKKPLFDLPGLVVGRPWIFVLGAVSLAGVMLLRAQAIPWSYDYLKLMPAELESIKAMATLSRRTDLSAEVSAVVVDSLEQAREVTRKLQAKPSIRRVESVASYIPTDQAKKLALLRQLAPTLDRHRPVTPRPVALDGINQALEELADNMQDARFEAKRVGAKEGALLDAPIAAVARLRQAIKDTPPGDVTRRLKALQALMMKGLAEGIDLLKKNVAARQLTVERLLASLPQGLQDRLVSGGKMAVYAYPASSIGSKAFLGQLVRDLHAVSPEATGFPVTHWEFSQSIEEGFKDAAIVATIVLVLMLLIDFRSIRYTLLAVAPLTMGVAWMWGGISLMGLSYNYVNVIAFPLIIGIGVASGVHILHRYRQEGETSIRRVVRFTGMAIFLSAATTMVGFGSLAMARHQGAASLGLVLLLGVGSCLATATLFLPALLRLIEGKSSE